MREIIRRPEAKRDLMDAADHIAEHGGFDASDRFLAATEATFRKLALMPGMGVVRNYGNPELPGLRMWPVPKFAKYLIFYMATETRLEIVRVLHGARDIERIFNPSDEG
ncbi:MAG: type II toxin-antitoxin system RelE/ParE family toxin [Armatimonadetes bacterium]|nr:type II toxin-antitoxin system RelE/ParE family toxin [Armatimonadota bacterium]